ncbi:hypothetical protein [Paenibacillus antibioticophila]|uniref:hypothetical protein n=1 Tax=Paenibacillus antibioticophila TaxID=1274374 RepID=UPI0005C9FFF2|nr:hypothetical protein [Paenibacillus antibioticophila]
MKIEEVGKLFDLIIEYYPIFSGDGDKLKAWHDVLRGVTYETAQQNLIQYASDPDNKFPPHPGALARRTDAKTDAERYHDHMKQTGVLTLAQYDQLRQGVVAPSSDIIRRVREQLG